MPYIKKLAKAARMTDKSAGGPSLPTITVEGMALRKGKREREPGSTVD